MMRKLLSVALALCIVLGLCGTLGANAQPIAAGCWISTDSSSRGKTVVAGQTMELDAYIFCTGPVGGGSGTYAYHVEIYPGILKRIPEDMKPVFSHRTVVNSWTEEHRVFRWDTSGCPVGDYTAIFYSTRDDYILTAQYADLYVTNTSKPLTGAAFMDEDGEVITSLTLYEGYTTRGDFDFFLTRSPYHATSGDELGTATVADPSIISLTQSHGFFSAKALKVGSTTITGTLNGKKATLQVTVIPVPSEFGFPEYSFRFCMHHPQHELTLQVSPYNGLPIKWRSYNEDVVKILKTEGQTVTYQLVGAGETILEAVYAGYFARATIRVYEDHCYYQKEYQPASCTEDGYIISACSFCGDEKREILPAYGHSIPELTVDPPNTATQPGVGHGFCQYCQRTVTVEIPPVFIDTQPKAYYAIPLDYCYEQGLVNGITATTFGPKVNLTRAMMVTLLYRMEGTPAVTGTCQFTDVEPGAFYYDAVLWGQENGIVQGTSDTKFSPKMNITREQLITFLYRYAQQKGMDTSIAGDLTAFTDADRIQPYAKDAMVWAVGVRLIQGITETTLAPAGTALRSQAVTFLYRFAGLQEA